MFTRADNQRSVRLIYWSYAPLRRSPWVCSGQVIYHLTSIIDQNQQYFFNQPNGWECCCEFCDTKTCPEYTGNVRK